MAKKTLQAIVEIGGSVASSLQRSTADAEKYLGKLNLKSLAVGAAVGGIAIAIGGAVIQSVDYLAELGDEYTKVVNQISSETGKTGSELENLGEIVKNVYGDNFGGSLEEAGKAVSTLEKVADLSGEALENSAKDAIALYDTFGYEVESTAKTASALMKNLGVDSDKAYNIIAYGAQNGADQNGDLLDTLNEYAAQYDALGLSADQFVAGLTNAADEGVFSIDKVGDAVKEFNIRSKDLSDSSADAYKTIGLDAETMFQKFGAGGETANQAFFETIQALENMEDPLKKNEAAVALFGTMYEDLGDDILPILASMENATLDNIDTLAQINDVKYDNLGAAWEGVKRKAEVALIPLATTVSNAFLDMMPMIENVIEGIIPVIDRVTQIAIPVIQELGEQLAPVFEELKPVIAQFAQEFASNVLPALIELVKAVLPVIVKLMKSLSPVLSVITTKILPVVLDVITALLPVIEMILDTLAPILVILLQLIDPILALVTTAIMPLIDVLARLYQQYLLVLGPVLEWLAGIIVNVFQNAILGLQPIIDSLTQVFEGILTFINGVFAGDWEMAWSGIVQTFGGIFDGIVAAIKFPLNNGISLINGFINGINQIQLPDFLPGIGGKGVSIPLIPMLAKGGFTDGVSIAGEAGMEAVISFDKSVRSANIGYWQQAGRMLGVYDTNQTTLAGQLMNMSDFSLSELAGNSGTVIYDFSGFQWSPKINTNGEDSDDFMNRLRTHEYEFFDWLERWIKMRGVTAFA